MDKEFFPEQMTYESLTLLYDEAIGNSLEKMSALSFASNEARLCALSALSTTHVLRPILEQPWEGDIRKSWPLLDVIGENFVKTRERGIDLVGQDLFRRAMHVYPIQDSAIWIEENKRWINEYGEELSNKDHIQRIIIVDPLDGTGCIGKNDVHDVPHRVQAFGMVVANKQGECIAGSVTSLVDDRIAIIDGDAVFLVRNSRFGLSGDIEPQHIDHDRFSIAMLDRRVEYLEQSALIKQNVFVPHESRSYYPTFGGEGLLTMLYGSDRTPYNEGYPLGVMADIVPGQVYHEALIWASLAKQLGMIVTDRTGAHIDIPFFMRDFLSKHEETTDDRLQVVISLNDHIARRFCEFAMWEQEYESRDL